VNLEAGVKVGDFEILSRLGAGGMGIVYRARQLSLNRVVALKILGPALDSEEGKARFRREAQAVARLKHPGIATVHFIGQDEQACFIAMEYVDGPPLRRVLDRLASLNLPAQTIDGAVRELAMPGTPPGARVERFDESTAAYDPPPRATSPGGNDSARVDVEAVKTSPTHIRRCCEIAHDVALALAHAHEQGVTHHDIKPENILLDRDGRPHVVDFGIARFVDDLTLTSTGALVGTPMYMSPEQVTGRFEVDHRTDIYSLGIMLYEMLTLRRPIEAATREGLFRQIVAKTRPPLTRRNRAAPRDLESVVHKAISLDPDARYQSAREFAAELQNVLEGKPVNAPIYRYERDQGEIAAARPSSVALVCVVFCAFLLVVSIGITFNILIQLIVHKVDHVGFLRLINAAGLLVGLLAGLFLVAGFYQGRGWTRWILSVMLLLMILYMLYNGIIVPRYFDIFIFIYICDSIFLLTVIHHGRTRQWMRLAARVRAEQRTEEPRHS
jgi:serine/threonine protein kinase